MKKHTHFQEKVNISKQIFVKNLVTMNIMKKVFPLLLSLLIVSLNTIAQTAVDSSVPMADKMREDGKIWVVVAVVAIIFAGIFINLLRLESKVGKIEKELKIK
jgi:hypothetical protein